MFNPSILIPVDITQEEKDLPQAILQAIPVPKLLLFGFKETPEQSDSEQAEEEFGKEGEKKLDNIRNQLTEAQVNFESKLIFSNEIVSQIKQIIEEEKFPFILSLQPLSELNQIVIPVFDLNQINTKLRTVIYNFQSKQPKKIKIMLFSGGDGESPNEDQLKQAIENQLYLVNINIDEYEVYQKEELSCKELIKKISKQGDLIVGQKQRLLKEKLSEVLFMKRNQKIVTRP